ncbi:acyltransferase family protein [Vibrio sp. CAIM 722]|uniref:Acyltransferase family protein n=1 Tax=Vibrio eleionomae TaxID=2653505 RepID=A0A7X4RX03_9VIBR|nr:acyltransferase family protein [Vibrio eleionomae]MZI95950.1 acyltransferase family protein [Vibrio eleionomae]
MVRDPRIDIFRGFLILLVVLGHVKHIPIALHHAIYAFHMPAFFILAGYLFNLHKGGSTYDTIAKKFNRLIIPAWVFGLICGLPFVAITLLHFNTDAVINFLTRLYGTLTGYPSWDTTFNCTPLWFLYALFIIEVIAILCKKLNENTFIITLVVLGVIGVLVSYQTNVVTPFNLLIGLSCLIYFTLGFFIKRISHSISKAWLFITPVVYCITYYIFVIHAKGDVISLAENNFGPANDFVWNMVLSLSGTGFALVISTLFAKNEMLSRGFSWLGVNTIPIIAFDYYVNDVFVKTFAITGISIPNAWLFIFPLKLAILVGIVWAVTRITWLNDIQSGKVQIFNKKTMSEQL